MTQTATRFEPQVWASIGFNCDAAEHAWGSASAQQSRPRMPAFQTALNAVLRQSSVDHAIAAVGESTRNFLVDYPRYSPDIVDKMLENAAFTSSYAAFLYHAEECEPDVARGPTLQRLPPRESALYKHVARLNELLADLQRHNDDTAVDTVNFDVVTAPKDRMRDLFWFVYDPGVPAAVADAMVGRLESEAASCIYANRPQTWTTDDLCAIIDDRERTLRRYARFLAGIKGSPITTVAPAERMNVDEVRRQHSAARKNLAAQTSRIIAETQR